MGMNRRFKINIANVGATHLSIEFIQTNTCALDGQRLLSMESNVLLLEILTREWEVSERSRSLLCKISFQCTRSRNSEDTNYRRGEPELSHRVPNNTVHHIRSQKITLPKHSTLMHADVAYDRPTNRGV